MAKRKIAGTVADGTLPKTPVTIGGKTYNLCLDLGALSEAETSINMEFAAAGMSDRVNMLIALCERNLANTRVLFAAGVRAFHPEIGFEEAREMVKPDNVFTVAMAIKDAYALAVETPGGDPPTAQATQ